MAIGIIHELTSDVPVDRPNVRRQRFTAIFCQTNLIGLRYLREYDLFYFEPAHDPDFPLPDSFEGMSGGAIWRFYVEEKEGPTSVVDSRLVGVPFFQIKKDEGRREIVCHGPNGIYGTLIEKIAQKWPEADNGIADQ
ncbi:MAG TPA: hypothetical protein VIJ04_15160 [Xanthobacteraceae bacterium]